MTHLDILKFLAKRQAHYMYDEAEGDDEDWSIETDEAECYIKLLAEIRRIEVAKREHAPDLSLATIDIDDGQSGGAPTGNPKEDIEKLVKIRVEQAMEEFRRTTLDQIRPPTAYTPGEERKPPWKQDG